jgi:hypothetical protein
METEAVLPHSQEPTNCPFPEPDQSSASPSFYFLKIPYLPTSRRGRLRFFFSVTFSYQKPVRTSPVSHSCHMLRSSRCLRGDFPKNVWWGVQTRRLLMMQYSPVTCYVVRLKPKWLPWHPILDHPKPVSSSVSEFKFHIVGPKKHYIFLYFNLCIFG